MSHGASEEESQPSKAEKIRSTTFLVLQREEFVTLRKWPNAPKVVDSSWYIKVADAAFDAFLFACSTTFLAFALVVHYSHGLYTTTTVHDRALEPTPRMNLLLSATKYVSLIPSWHTLCGTSCSSCTGPYCIPYFVRFRRWSINAYHAVLAYH
jgi:hypothetical protein